MAKVLPDTVEARDDPKFPYSLELVALVATRFVDGNTNDSAAAARAIKLLDAVSKTIEAQAVLLGARVEADRRAKEAPDELPFAKAIRRITGKKTETEATKAFRDYLRLKLRMSALGNPRKVTKEQAKALLEPLVDGKAEVKEEAEIAKRMAAYRSAGFSQVDLVKIKESFDLLQANLIRPYRNSEKGKRGGRPRGSKKKTRKSLVRSPILEK